jgi:hypothetical protein
MSLTVKDGNNTPRELETIFGTGTNLVPVHSITGSISADISEQSVNDITGSIDKVTEEIAKLTALSSSAGYKISGSVSLNDYAALSGTISSSAANAAAQTIAEIAKLTALSSSAGYKISGSVSLYDYAALSGTISSSAATTTAEIAKLTALSSSAGYKVSGSVSLNDYTALSGTISSSAATTTAEVAKLTALSGSNGLKVEVSTAVTSSVAYSTTTVDTVLTAASVVSGNKLFTSLGGNQSAKTFTISNYLDKEVYVKLSPTGTAATLSNYSLIIPPYSVYEAQPENTKLWHYVIAPAGAAGSLSALITQ